MGSASTYPMSSSSVELKTISIQWIQIFTSARHWTGIKSGKLFNPAEAEKKWDLTVTVGNKDIQAAAFTF